MFMVLRRPRAARLVELKLSLAVCLACLVDNVLIPLAAIIEHYCDLYTVLHQILDLWFPHDQTLH